MSFMWIAAPILPPFPIKDWGSNSAVVNNVGDSFLFSLLGIFTNLIDQVSRLIKSNS